MHTTGGGEFPVVLSQFNFLGNTPNFINKGRLDPDKCAEFLQKSARTLKKYTSGSDLWAYRNYRQSEIFNTAFLKGLDGWSTFTGGEGVVLPTDGGALLDARGGFAVVAQGVKQVPKSNCDDKNNNMRLCVKHRGLGQVQVVWDGTEGRNVVSSSLESSELSYTEACHRLPALDDHHWYLVGLRVEGAAAVTVSSVQHFCHTHNMMTHDVHGARIATCGDHIPKLNAMLA